MSEKNPPTADLTQEEAGPERHDVAELHGPIQRERLDPREGYEPVPLWFISLCGLLVFWSGWYLSQYGGGGDPEVLDPRPEARFSGLGAADAPKDPRELGRKLYTANCVSCHQQSGLGVSGQYPPLVASEWVVGEPAVLKRILLQGLAGPIEVKGQAYNGNMPAFGERQSDEQIAAVLSYIRTEWGNAAATIPAESVAATRAATRDRRKPWTAVELAAITADDWQEPAEAEEKEPDPAGK